MKLRLIGSVMVLLLSATPAFAATPSDVWTAANVNALAFSADGTSILVSTTTGFQLRRASSGAVEKTITIPEASRSYDAVAFSPDKQLIALTYRASGVTRIELYNTSNGALARSIDSGAVRNARGIDVSSSGLVALYERYAYGDGGTVRIFNASTGSLVRALGQYTRNSTTELTFSPNGSFLAIQNLMPSDPTGVVILRTSDWSEVQRIGNNAGLFEWSRDSAGVWVMTRQGATEAFVVSSVDVPGGQIASSANIDTNTYLPDSVTPDDRFMLSSVSTNDAVVFLRTSNGSVAQRFSVAQRAWAGRLSPKNDFFTYSVCSDTACALHVARVPAL